MSSVYRFSQLVCGVVVVVATANSAAAQPLVGSGNNLPVPPNPGPPPSEAPALTLSDPNDLSLGFSGDWGPPNTPPVFPGWTGTFLAFGPIPSSNLNPPGLTRYNDFTGLGATCLPSGTYFVISDVDGGSFTAESLTLTAWDTSGNPITQPWLSVPQWVWGGLGVSDPNAMPGWSFTSGVYYFTGATVDPGYNPNVALAFESLLDIGRFTVDRPNEWCNFGLRAPIPEPTSLALLLLGGLAMFRCGGRRDHAPI